jgi:hypothetical protein
MLRYERVSRAVLKDIDRTRPVRLKQGNSIVSPQEMMKQHQKVFKITEVQLS